jgi:hypothetical protein
VRSLTHATPSWCAEFVKREEGRRGEEEEERKKREGEEKE